MTNRMSFEQNERLVSGCDEQAGVWARPGQLLVARPNGRSARPDAEPAKDAFG